MYWDGDRPRQHYISSTIEISSISPDFANYCRDNGVQLVCHEDVSPSNPGARRTGKLCAVLNADDFEKMATLLIEQKVVLLERV